MATQAFVRVSELRTVLRLLKSGAPGSVKIATDMLEAELQRRDKKNGET